MKKRRFEMGKGIKYSKIGKLLMAASMSVCFAGLTAYSLYAAEQKPESATKKEVVSEEIKPEAMRAEEGFCYTAALTLGRAGDSDGQSECTLLEDGKPLSTSHSYHQEIRDTGKGKYSHWTKEALFFSTSDNSDPRTNGRKYTLASTKSAVSPVNVVEQKPVAAAKKEVVSEEIKPEAINQEEGFCYTAALTLGREGDHDGQSECTLLEDGKPLSTPRASHQEIRNIGKGKYSHWTKEVLYFSTSDNSDPRTNGRKYTLTSNKKQ